MHHDDESLVPDYVLPPILKMESGEDVRSRDEWFAKRRPELLQIFSDFVYGRQPPTLPIEAEIAETGIAFDGLAVREQVQLRFVSGGREPGNLAETRVSLLIYRPKGMIAPCPVFLGLNFRGNETLSADPFVFETTSWRRAEEGRGTQAARWPLEDALRRGYAVATFYSGDIAPDSPDHWRSRIVREVFPKAEGKPGETEPGAIAWWAWGLSRVLDYLESRSEYDRRRVTVFGHSRQGKAALWAAAQDERFAIAISNNSGCTGAALARRCFGETVEEINLRFPHWFCERYKSFAGREACLPIDQHQLLALIAPRPLYVASASEDAWADPKGEYLAALGAAPAYQLLGEDVGLLGGWPAAEQPVGQRIGYHLRTGKHGITKWDWERFLDFADRQW